MFHPKDKFMKDEGVVFCLACGGKNRLGKTYCDFCGKELPKDIAGAALSGAEEGGKTKRPDSPKTSRHKREAAAKKREISAKKPGQPVSPTQSRSKAPLILIYLLLGAALVLMVALLIGRRSTRELSSRASAMEEENVALRDKVSSGEDAVKKLEDTVKELEESIQSRDASISDLEKKVKDLENEKKVLKDSVTSRDRTISNKDKSIAEMRPGSEAYQHILTAALSGKVGYASSRLYAEKGLVGFRVGESAKNVAVTWRGSEEIYLQTYFGGTSAKGVWSKNWSDYTTQVVLTPTGEGLTIFRIYNKSNTEELFLIVLVEK